jgi:hypothetical protein
MRTSLGLNGYTAGVFKRFFLSCLVGLVFVGCAREVDSIAPQIVIVKPRDGKVTQTEKLEVEGYAWDDAGVLKVVVNGERDLMVDPKFKDQRGRKLVKFSFIATSLSSQKAAYEVRAVDIHGHSSTTEINITRDTKAPNINVENLDSLSRTVAITGTIEDNIQVKKVLVNGDTLNIAPASKIPFYAVVNRNRRGIIVIEAFDAVGNKASRSVYMPTPPAPPPVPVTPRNGTGTGTEANSTTGTTTQTTTPRRRRRRLRTTTQQPSSNPAPVVVPTTPR